jgi:hypothetical protein
VAPCYPPVLRTTNGLLSPVSRRIAAPIVGASSATKSLCASMIALTQVNHCNLLIAFKSAASAGVATLFNNLALELSALPCRGLSRRFSLRFNDSQSFPAPPRDMAAT